jgi:hypothetical protein
MKIDVSNGSILFAAGTIERKADRSHFLASAIGRDAKAELVNEDWRHYGIRPEPGVAANLVFKGDRLHQVWLLMEIPSDKTEEWTVESEMQRKALHDSWLLSELGSSPYDHSWGRIDSEFDAKGCVSEIIVTYAD